MDRPIEKKKWTAKKIFKIAAVALVVILPLYLIFFRDNRSKLTVEKDQLRIATVEKNKFQEFIPLDGVVLPIRTVYIDAIEGGTVDKVYVEDGAKLKAGDVILKLQNANLELEYMNRESQMYDVINNLQNSKLSIEQNKFVRRRELVDLENSIDIARKDFNRKKNFYVQKVISDKEFEDAKREYEYLLKKFEIALGLNKMDSVANITQIAQINSSIDRMSKNLALLRENLENLYIKAPIDGQLTSFSVEIGETKSAGQHLGQIDVTTAYKLRSDIDERYISRVFKGQEARFTLNQKEYIVEVSKIFTNVANGTFQVEMIFPGEAPSGVKRGQTFQLRLMFSGTSDAIIIPRGGFFQETGGNWIYLVDEQNQVANKKSIRIGRQNTMYYEVLDGLEPGQKVVVSSYTTFGNKDQLILK